MTDGSPTATSEAPARSEDALRGLVFDVPDGPLPFLEPVEDPLTDFYWRGEEDGVLRLLTCGDCGYITHPPSPRCGRCHRTAMTPQPVSGRGTLWSWTVNVQPFIPGIPPFCVASVRIDEQDDVRITAPLVGCSYEDIVVDMPVEVLFGQGAGGVRVPMFRPVSA
jgi:uncharacterized OB-fold protein